MTDREAFEKWLLAETLLDGVTIRESRLAWKAWQEAIKQERERSAASALRVVNGRVVGPTLCDVAPEVLRAASVALMEDPEYRAKMFALSARSETIEK